MTMLIVILCICFAIHSQADYIHQKSKQSIRINLKVNETGAPPNSTVLLNNRIVGGNEAPRNAYPFVARLNIEYMDGNWGSCGGTLINSHYIMTASHCMFQPQTNSPVQLVQVFLGDHNALIDEPTEIYILSTYVIVHEQYSNLMYDIALVYLPQQVIETTAIQHACLSSPGRDFVNWAAKAIGWGATGTSEQGSPVLKEVNMPIVSSQPCAQVYPGLWTESIQICTWYYSDYKKEGTCYGDSGGPLFVGEQGTVTVVGLTSYGPREGCAIYGTVFTKVSAFINWIYNNIQGQICLH